MLKNDRKFTKAELQAMTIDNFVEYDKAIKKIDSEDMLSIKEISDSLRKEREDSVWGRYVSGSISMIRRPHEDNINMQNLNQAMNTLTANNTESHRRIWAHNDEQDEKLENHEKRITKIETKMDIIHPEHQ